MYFPYAFPKELYTAPASNAILGMVANYQSGPAIYKYLMENNGVKKVAFVAANESDPLSQRDSGVEQDDIVNERTGIVMGSGGPTTSTIVEAADITREKGSPKRIGPFAVPKAMSSGFSRA